MNNGVWKYEMGFIFLGHSFDTKTNVTHENKQICLTIYFWTTVGIQKNTLPNGKPKLFFEKSNPKSVLILYLRRNIDFNGVINFDKR